MSYDHQEQEQIDAIKIWWNKHGNLVMSAVTAVLLAFAAYNGWLWYQRSQTQQASLLYEELERGVSAKDNARVVRVATDLAEKYGSTPYADMGGVLAAKALSEAGDTANAKSRLQWVAEHGKDEAYQYIAKLRLAGMLADEKAYDEALKQVSGKAPAAYEALFADRMGDILLLQGKKSEAKAAYDQALLKVLDREEAAGFISLVEQKLQILAVPLDLTGDLTAEPVAAPVTDKPAVDQAAAPAAK
ncbi:YfgM family protein [Ampullimonas aquatilis]|uniref:YfgM family protein n=1 Tax=Ampullimonas aquatilis TaxID=1341549 RepID=UPI003C71532C